MFPVGSSWLRIRSRSKAKSVFEVLIAAMFDAAQKSCSERQMFNVTDYPTLKKSLQKVFKEHREELGLHFIADSVYLKKTATEEVFLCDINN